MDSFQSGCGVCRASKDYVDQYYAQPQTQSGAGKKKKTTTSTKKKSTVSKKKKSATSTKKKSATSTKKKSTVSKKKRSMSGGFKLDESFIKQNLGIAFETVGGGARPLPKDWFSGRKFMDSPILPGYDATEKLAPVKGGAKKKSVSSKKKATSSIKKKKSTSTKKKSTSSIKKKKVVSKKKTTSKKD